MRGGGLPSARLPDQVKNQEGDGDDRPKRYGVGIGVTRVRSGAGCLTVPLVVRVRQSCPGDPYCLSDPRLADGDPGAAYPNRRRDSGLAQVESEPRENLDCPSYPQSQWHLL